MLYLPRFIVQESFEKYLRLQSSEKYASHFPLNILHLVLTTMRRLSRTPVWINELQWAQISLQVAVEVLQEIEPRDQEERDEDEAVARAPDGPRGSNNLY